MSYYSEGDHIRRLRLLVALLASLANPAISGAQESPVDVDTVVRVSLGRTSAQPNEIALIPIYFAPPPVLPIGRLKFDLTFVSVNLKFEQLEPGPVIDVGAVDFHTEVSPGKNENGVETDTVTIQAEVPVSTAAGIPSGLIAYLHLRLSAEAQPAQITLRTSSAEALRLGSNEPWPEVEVLESRLEVQAPGYEPPVVCFFFSH